MLHACNGAVRSHVLHAHSSLGVPPLSPPAALSSCYGDVVAQEELGGLDVDGELVVKRLQLSVGGGGAAVHAVAVVDVHDDVLTRAIAQDLVEVAGVILGLLVLLHLRHLLYHRPVPNAPRVSLTIQGSSQAPHYWDATDVRAPAGRWSCGRWSRIKHFTFKLTLEVRCLNVVRLLADR